MKWNDKINWNFKARNRIFMAPMDTLMATNGFVNDFHIQHYAARSYGGVGAIIVESTAVMSNGLIRVGDLGIWSDEHIDGLTKLATIIKSANASVGIQLNHAGAKAELKSPIVRWGTTKKYFDYIDQSNLKLLEPSDLLQLENAYVEAAHRAKKAGFDFVELHGAHGYMLNAFMHKLLNEVTFDSDICKRAEIVTKIAKRIKDEVKIPVGIRLSVTDHVEGGMTEHDYLPIIQKLEPYLSYVHVSSGETIGHTNVVEAMSKAKTHLFRLPLATYIKQHTNLPVIVVGNVSSSNDVDLILEHKIDAIAIGRELIFNPGFVLNTLANSVDLDDKEYHWNNSPWFNFKNYLGLKEKIKPNK